jgi:8-oxo-dGTP pyrophosphatase MutT (NUDIX family)
MADHVLESWKHYLREDLKAEEAADGQAAGFIIVSNDDDVLLIRRSEGDHLGQLTGTGGSMEAGEEPYHTATRETKEEVGRSFEGLDPLEEEPHVHETPGLVFTTYLMGSLNNFPCELNQEHDAWGWIDIDDIKHAIDNRGGEIVSNKFYDRSGKPTEIKAKLHDGVINAMKGFKL